MPRACGAQIAVGAALLDAVVLAGWQYAGSSPALVSMALRALGNLTQQDGNIYVAVGLGAARSA